MKRICALLVAVSLAFTLSAQQNDHDNYLGLNLGAGINSMVCNPTNGTNGLGLDLDAGLHFTHFFGKHFGFGFAVHYNYANSSTEYNFTDLDAGLTHPHNPNVSYDLSVRFDNWREKQTVGFLSVPLEFFWRAPMGDRWNFIAGLGASFDLPLHGQYSAEEGSYTTSGYFPATGHSVYNAPEHGFSTYDADKTSDIDNLGFSVSVIADLGFRLALKNNWGLYLGLYGGYGVADLLEEQYPEAPLLTIDNNDPTRHVYNGTFASSQIDALHQLRAGIKVGIDLGWIGAKRKAAEEAALQARQKAVADSIAAVEAAAKAAREKAAAEREAAERAAERAAAAAAKAAAEKAAIEKADQERAAREKARLDSIAAAQAFMPAKPVTRQEMQQKLDDINATVYFETKGTTPKFDDKTDAIIRTLCASMMADHNLKAEITGHTDNTGAAAINIKYGQKRAEALKNYMVSLGAPAENIETKSRGMEEPIVPNDSDANRAKNRRATVILK
jgi:outer membrane protein OmpA-like peptidoglycan-associated protein